MIPELCVVKYQSVTKSDSHCIIKSGCKIRHSNGTLSSDELPDNRKEKPLGSLLVRVKPSGLVWGLNDIYRSRLRPIEQPKPRINGTSKYVYRKSYSTEELLIAMLKARQRLSDWRLDASEKRSNFSKMSRPLPSVIVQPLLSTMLRSWSASNL